MEYVIIGIAAFFLVIIVMIRDEFKRKRDNLKKIKEAWGKSPKREYSYEEFESISHYSKKMKSDFRIDDITWNDLGMDPVFMLLNNTHSSVGEEYLYHVLRTPVFDENILNERERLIEYFGTHEDDRTKLQMLFMKMGRTRTLSIVDYIDSLDEIERKGVFSHVFMGTLLLTSIAVMLIYPQVGVLFFILMIGNNVINYYKSKSKIEPYIITFGYIMKMLNAVDKLEKLKFEEIAIYINKLSKSKNKFNQFRRNSSLLAAKGLSGSINDILMDYIRILFHPDIIKFYSMLKVVDKNKEEIGILLENLGILESAIAIGSFREYLPYFVIPNFNNDKNDVTMKADNTYHPMIDEPVENSVKTGKSILVTGSNASGKSTFLKTVAICTILSQTIHTSTASYYRGNFYKIMSSMALRDDLMKKESYYIVEIKALKRILDESEREGNLLCFIDEVLRGTNTVERIAASAQILKSLAKENVICFAATHDIELTYMMDGYYENYHFEEEIEDNDILFNYKLQLGRAQSQNAIKLLSIIGYDDEIIEHAKRSATGFLENGDWILT